MTPSEQFKKTWDVAYRILIAWVRTWLPEPDAVDAANSAVCFMLRRGMNGQATSYGPWRELYEQAEKYMRWWGQVHGKDIPNGLWRTIPLTNLTFLCDFAQAYCVLYQAAELGSVSIPEQDTLIGVFSRGAYDELGQWCPQLGDVDVPVVMSIIDRVIRACEAHIHGPGDDCVEFATLWAREDACTDRWYHNTLGQEKGDFHGVRQQDHHPGVNRS